MKIGTRLVIGIDSRYLYEKFISWVAFANSPIPQLEPFAN